MNGISRDTFEQLSDSDKLNVMYDLHCDSNKQIKELKTEIEMLKGKAMRWGGAGGVITAIGAYLASLFLHNMTK